MLELAALLIAIPPNGPVAAGVADAPAPVMRQVRGRADCVLALDRGSVALSGRLRVTLRIEGPEPVEVDVPRPITSSPDWRVKPDPPRIAKLGNGRERWEQVFHLEPFQVGDVTLPLQPVRLRTGNEVKDWTLTWPSPTVPVKSSVKELDLGSAERIADIERGPIEERPARPMWPGVMLTLAVIVAAALTASRLRRRGLPAVERSPRERALAELRRLESDGPRPDRVPELADVLRRFLEDHYRLAATRQTTAEFEVTLRGANVLTASQIEIVSDILNRCDLVKFAGVRPAREACEGLLRAARVVVAAAGEPGEAVPPGSSEAPR